MKRIGAHEAVADHAEVARRGQADRGPHRQAFEVADFAEPRPRLVAAAGVEEEELHRVVPPPDALDVRQRFEQLGPERPRAHGGLGFVEEIEKRAAALAVERANQLEVANRCVVQDEAVTGGVERRLVNLGMSLVRACVVEHQRRRAARGLLAR